MSEEVPTIIVPWTSLISEREREVLNLYLEGCEVKEIASALFISPKTVGVHMWSIRNKMRPLGLRFIRQVTDLPKTIR